MVTDALTSSRTGALTIGIIGLGPRGLSVLERLLAMAEHTTMRLKIAIFEPGELGVGVHSVDLPDHLVLNTIACQLSAFPDRASLEGGPDRTGPSLYEWSKTAGIKVPCSHGSSRLREAEPTDFLPRRHLGRYLSWAYSRFLAQAPGNVTIEEIRANAIRMERLPQGDGYRIVAETGDETVVDKAFITIGHPRNPGRPGNLGLAARPASVVKGSPNATVRDIVEISGLGLTAMDAIASLTVGTSGRFEKDKDGRTRYVPSGREPGIVLFSRSGLPFHARPRFLATHRKHAPALFTEARIAELRASQRNGLLDFERHLLPMLKAEMVLAYYDARAKTADIDSDIRERFRSFSNVDCEESAAGLTELRDELARDFGPFDPDDFLITTLPADLREDDYRNWFVDYLTDDLSESKVGLARSARKCALEVWRDLRDMIRLAVDFDGLSTSSRVRFYSIFSPLINRLVAGPHIERQEQFLALLGSGIVRLTRFSDLPAERLKLQKSGRPTPFDGSINTGRTYIVTAQVGNHNLRDANASLPAQLIQSGILSQLEGASSAGIKVDEEGHAIDARGTKLTDLWVFGPLVEGATYYNHYVSSPNSFSRAVYDANRAARECLTGAAVQEAA
ncbi:hypothetical protein A8H39_00625 [Paraburkholderia fungorum]|uniref:FAD/NAD(P)-binding protein n=1 Tax=Paraburkholderia fungorum TaxID=134537 RepID=UPI000483E9AB|nr:FAD/NAD(P)-binding protein [Paraburkholderia fungorum]PNE59687.1 hypothetical protein A8H39_00625 [Paraburkholderia fungorum]